MLQKKQSHECEELELGLSQANSGIFFQHHRPYNRLDNYHYHASIEINYLRCCDMTYSFSGELVTIRDGCFSVFWAAYPHRAISATADGTITNAYVTLSEFLRWNLPVEFVTTLMSGAILSVPGNAPGDDSLVRRWEKEIDWVTPDWQNLHAVEIRARLYRMALEGWDCLYKPKDRQASHVIGGNAILHFEQMLRFIAANYSEAITTKDVADSADVSQNYAMSLFKKMLGQSIKEHIIEMRIVQAKMLLTNTEKKILTVALDCGFGSLSSFYEAFGKFNGLSPAAFRNGARLPDRQVNAKGRR